MSRQIGELDPKIIIEPTDQLIIADPNDLDPIFNNPITKRIDLQSIGNLVGTKGIISMLIEFPEDPDDEKFAPLEQDIYTIGNKKIRLREFARNDWVTWDLTLPIDFDVFQPVQFRVKGIITHIDGISNEEISFSMSAYAVNDGESVKNSFSSPISVSKTLNQGENTYFVTDWSNDVTINNLVSMNSMNQFLFKRNTDAYEERIGISEIEIRYSKKVFEYLPSISIVSPLNDFSYDLNESFDVELSFSVINEFQLWGSKDDGETWTVLSSTIPVSLFDTTYTETISLDYDDFDENDNVIIRAVTLSTFSDVTGTINEIPKTLSFVSPSEGDFIGLDIEVPITASISGLEEIQIFASIDDGETWIPMSDVISVSKIDTTFTHDIIFSSEDFTEGQTVIIKLESGSLEDTITCTFDDESELVWLPF